jgi:hypothetical protein
MAYTGNIFCAVFVLGGSMSEMRKNKWQSPLRFNYKQEFCLPGCNAL